MATITTVLEEEECPIAFIPNLPRLKFHGAPFYFMSEAGMTQQEYQKHVLANGLTPDADDTMIIKCPDREDGAGRIFYFKRSVLRRSPTLAKFFESAYYLQGCNMHLTFVVDPAVCIDIVYKYLEDGPDIFRQTVLRVQLTMRYKLIDRSIILVRLYALAQKLDLPSLTEMTFGVLCSGDLQLTAANCLTLSSLVFAHTAGFDKKLKDWCFDHVKQRHTELEGTALWNETLWKTEMELSQRWTQLMDEMEEMNLPLDTVNEVTESPELRQSIQHIASGEDGRDSSSTTVSKEQGFQEVLDEVAQGVGDNDEVWDRTPPAAGKNPGNADKIMRLLGPDKASPGGLKRANSSHGILNTPRSSVVSPTFNKAHFVMGYPGTEEQVKKNRRSSMSSTYALSTTPSKLARRMRLFAAS
ncbi:MAG: hypothetical protein Q9181_005895 [Wetmoreana brouardii]